MEKGMKKKVGEDRSRQWHSNYRDGPGPFSKVSNLNNAVWIMHENHWNCHMSVLQESDCCLIFWVPKWYLFSLSLYSIFLLFPQKNWVAFQISRCFKIFFFSSFQTHFKLLTPLFLLENSLMKMFQLWRRIWSSMKNEEVKKMMLKKGEVDILRNQSFLRRKV